MWVLHQTYPYEGFMTTEELNDLTRWFDLASELKTEISCVENPARWVMYLKSFVKATSFGDYQNSHNRKGFYIPRVKTAWYLRIHSSIDVSKINKNTVWTIDGSLFLVET